MKSLASVSPSPEQLLIVRRMRAGVEIIRGAAGSGKTTSALLKLKLLVMWFQAHRRRDDNPAPVRALVLTFNKTLRGYINDLVLNNIPEGNAEVTVETFGRWAVRTLGRQQICEESSLLSFARGAAQDIGLSPEFLAGEAEYAIGRFPPEAIANYLSSRRDGRGTVPRVERSTRQLIIERIILPYQSWKASNNFVDWNDIAIQMAHQSFYQYDVIIVDEAQDFSANQLRAILAQRHESSTVSFILDTAQRIYSRGFTWSEVGLNIRPENTYRLSTNYRNTPEIARLAANLIQHITLDEDGTAPVPSEAVGNPIPVMLVGEYSRQVEWCINYIKNSVNLETETVGFLSPAGWFAYLKIRLVQERLDFIVITKKSEWEVTDTNVALSTLHSAKGLDFDHCIMIGLSGENLPDGNFPEGDERFDHAARLLSMAIGRARRQVILGYKGGEEPAILHTIDPACYERKIL